MRHSRNSVSNIAVRSNSNCRLNMTRSDTLLETWLVGNILAKALNVTFYVQFAADLAHINTIELELEQLLIYQDSISHNFF